MQHSLETVIKNNIFDTTKENLKWFHWMVIALSISLTFGAWYYAKNQVEEKILLKYERESINLVEQVKERMVLYANVLQGGVALADMNSENISYKNWLSYAKSLRIDQFYPGINGIGVIFNVSSENKAAFIAKQRIERPNWHMHPEHDESEYWPISHIEPSSINAKAVGLDMAFETNRYTSIKRARDTGLIRLTAPITLIQDSKKTPGFLLYAPFYKDGQKPQTIETRRQNIVGVIYAPFIMSKLVKGALSEKNRFIQLRISDQNTVLYEDNIGTADEEPFFSSTTEIEMYGRPWLFEMSSNKAFRLQSSKNQPVLILFAGLFINLLLLVLLIFLAKSKNETEAVNKELALKEKLLADAQSIVHLGSWSLDLTSNKLVWSDEIFNIFELDKDTFTPSYNAFIDVIHPDDRDYVSQAYADSLKNQTSYKIEHRLQMADGSIKYVEEQCWTEFDAINSSPLKSFGTVHDITERKHNEILLLEAKELADSANKEKSQFLANMSHELRTPMHGILSFASLGLKAPDKLTVEKIEMYFTRIKLSGERLLVLINGLLDLSKLEAGKMEVDFKNCNLISIIQMSIEEQQARLDDLNIKINFEHNNTSGMCICDPIMIQQVITNLLSNAIKFTLDGKQIDIAISEDQIKGNHDTLIPAFLFTIKDKGNGIPHKELENIFKSFIQSSRNSSNAGGTGLGLSICKEIIKLHGGKIWAENHKDGGAIFKFLIPAQQETISTH